MIAPLDPIPESDSVVRLTTRSRVGTLPNDLPTQAFRLRSEKNETELSCQWFEYFPQDHGDASRWRGVCAQMSRNMLSPIKPSDVMLRVSVGQSRKLLTAVEALMLIQILYTPVEPNTDQSRGDPSHASIVGIPALEPAMIQTAQALLAESVFERFEWRELHELGLTSA
jgi:hypothetical protein